MKCTAPQTTPDTHPAPEPEVILSAPLRIEVLVGAIFFLFSAGFFLIFPWVIPAKSASDRLFLPLLFNGIGLLILWGMAILIASLREYVRADNAGLYGRYWRGPERFIAWSDVDDYHHATAYAIVQTQQYVSGFGGKVIGRDGTQLTFVRGWSDTALLAKRIQERAVNAKTHEWTVKGARPHDAWPHTFHYQNWANRIVPWLSLPIILSALYLSFALYRSTAAYIPFMGWGYCATFTLLGGSVVWLMALTLINILVPDKQTRTRMHQRITLTHDGIKFTDDDGSVFIGWEQVTTARVSAVKCFRPGIGILETDVGTIDFTQRICDAAILSRAILYNCPRVHEWRLPEDNNALPTRHVTSSGGFVHHYRTYSNRLWIILGWSFPLCLWLGSLAELSMIVEPRLLSLAGVFSVLFVPPLLWFGWLYKRMRVERDEDGLTFYTAFGVRHLLWSQVTDFRQRDMGGPRVCTIESRAGRFVFYSGISESDRLIRAIEAHLPTSAAVNDAALPQPETTASYLKNDEKPLILSSQAPQ